MDTWLILKVKEHRHLASLLLCVFVFSLSDIHAFKILDSSSRYWISLLVVCGQKSVWVYMRSVYCLCNPLS